MDFVKYISTPAATTEADPVKTILQLSRGRLAGGFLYFPRGPSGYLHFTAYIATFQILPFNTEESYRLNGCVVPIHLDIDFFQPPYQITFETWNDSALYTHVMTVGIFLDPYANPRKGKNFIANAAIAVAGYLKGADRNV